MKAALLALALAATPADPSALFALYAQGHYQDAMRRGEDSHAAEGLAIAARAALADAMTRPEPCLPCLQRAEDDARRAIALDTRLADGHVWLATSLGYEASDVGVTGIAVFLISLLVLIAVAGVPNCFRNCWPWASTS